MTSLSTFMSGDHRDCDELLAALEDLVRAGDQAGARAAHAQFDAAMRCHFRREEALLFPAFEAATGRMEHDQMRSMLDMVAAAVEAAEADRCLGLTDTLMVLIQQHNMKEEQVLYPMCDRAIPTPDALLARLEAFEPETC
jgi:iron-sulfur cluster repair protein YtfE (RIC family)